MGQLGDKELAQALTKFKEVEDEDRFKYIEQSLKDGYDLRKTFFKTAGIDEHTVEEIENEAADESVSLEQLCALIAPELRKTLSVQLDPSSAEPGEIKFKKTDENILDEIGMSDEELAKMLTLFAKCYKDDNQKDWHDMSQMMLRYVDAFFAPAYKAAEESGLLNEEDER